MATLLDGAALASAAESLTFNGYHAGMPKAAAKSIGVETCRNGEGPADTKDAIYCDIPASKRSLGTMTATKAVLELKAPSHASVNQNLLGFLGAKRISQRCHAVCIWSSLGR